MGAPVDSALVPRLGYAYPTVSVVGTRIAAGSVARAEETLAEETPIILAYNLSPYAVMMATPQDLEDFAVGFSLTEGVVASPTDILGVTVVRHGRGGELQVDVPEAIGAAMASRSRRLSGRTGCGICGADDLDRVLRELPHVTSDTRIEPSAITCAMRSLAKRQPLNDETGAAHAAGWARSDGTLEFVREDVGRHNALDKLIGALIRANENAGEGFIVITSRASFELVQKAAIVGVSLLAAVSAPTALAVRMAERAGLTLVGFAREDRLTVYSHEERVIGGSSEA